MNGLEHELRALAPLVEWPETPDVASAVAARVEASPPRRRPLRGLGLAFAVVLLTLAVALAVPPARTAIFDWFGIGSARIVRVDELPPLQLNASVARSALDALRPQLPHDQGEHRDRPTTRPHAGRPASGGPVRGPLPP